MAKSKSKETKKAEAAAPVSRVKNAGVAKASQTPKAKSKELAKAAAKKVVKEEPKKKKEESKKKKVVEPESESSEEEEESDSSASESGSDSDSEEETTKKEVKKPAAKGKAKEASSDSESDSESSSEEEETKKPAVNGKAKAESSDSESDSDSESEEEEEKPKAKAATTESSNSDSDSNSDDESEDEKKPATKESESNDSSDSDSESEDDSDDSDEEEAEAEKAAPASKKRKAEDDIDATSKKAKADEPGTAPTLFVGSLSWGVDDDKLYKAFESFEGLVNARVVTDKNTGRSRGFGYVDFQDSASAAKAYEAMQGKEVEGRALNLDYANARPTDATPQVRAADRAKKHGDSLSTESDTLFVGNLPFDVDQDTVTQFFSEVRPVASVRLPTDPESGNLKGFGYVSFNSVEDAKAALEEKNGAPIGTGRSSRNVRLDYSSPRPQGGAGGRGGGRGGRGGPRGGGGRGRGGGRGGGGGFSSVNRTRPGSNFSGTKISFD